MKQNETYKKVSSSYTSKILICLISTQIVNLVSTSVMQYFDNRAKCLVLEAKSNNLMISGWNLRATEVYNIKC